jgi:hypothetical protein
MTQRELFLLSPYRLPTHNSLTLGDEEIASFLNGYTALWHPSILEGALGPPKIVAPFDHDQPTAGHVYSVPQTPPPFLPDDWHDRVRTAGAVAFAATGDRQSTLEAAREAFASQGTATGIVTNRENVEPASFFGLGFGYLQLEALAEAMSHEKALDAVSFWSHVQQAAAAFASEDQPRCESALKAAAERLLAAREVMYPVTIHLLDICFANGDPWRYLAPPSKHGTATNLVAPGAELEKLARDASEEFSALRADVASGRVEVCGGSYLERDDSLLPIESQVWNLLKGLTTSRDLLGADVRVFARKVTSANPKLPSLLESVGLRRALLLAFDEVAILSARSGVVEWASPAGKKMQALTRPAADGDAPQTYFNLAHSLHDTIMHDHVATLVLRHGESERVPWHDDWLALSRLAPVLGRWTTVSHYLDEVPGGEEMSPNPDDFSMDSLSERVQSHEGSPVSGLARRVRLRREVETCWTLAAMHRALTRPPLVDPAQKPNPALSPLPPYSGGEGQDEGGKPSMAQPAHPGPLYPEAGARGERAFGHRLSALEDRIESSQDPADEASSLEKEIAAELSERLLAKAAAATPGYMFLNPCSFARRVAVEVKERLGPLSIAGPLRACQAAGDSTYLVVEIPALGFAWIPRSPAPAAAPQAARMHLADERHVRNEFFEAEIDPVTGGLRGIWDHRSRVSRVGQQLVFQPGSSMRASSIRMTSTGPALGELVSEGELVDQHQQVLARFRQRFRAWLGRPVLDVDIEIDAERMPHGYPWHAYFGARFAWRDERSTLLRSVGGSGYVTNHTRPVTTDYVEIRQGRQSTALILGGLPFLQRHGSRMLDVILVPPEEKARSFHLGIGLDREYPTHTAQGFVTPVPVVPVAKGPPHVGAAGWLFHVDASNVLVTSIRPGPEGEDAVRVRLIECGGYSARVSFRSVRDPAKASLVNARGEPTGSAQTSGDAAIFQVDQGAIQDLELKFDQ